MDSERAWKWAERVGPVVIAPLCSVAALYYAAATYYGWDKQVAPPTIKGEPWWSAMTETPWLGFALLCVAIASVLTSWGMIFIRRRAEKQKAAGQEFIPRGALISLNEIEFNVGRLSQAAPWLELYLTFSNATGYDTHPIAVTGRVTISGQEFRDHIELANALTSFGSAPFFRLGLKVPLSTSEAEYCLDTIRRKNLSISFPDSTVTFGISIHDGKARPTPLVYAWLPKTIHINPVSLRSDPYIPWLPPYR
jgi:hypothetical protein